jgi:purine-binding chemotaxis protein CheW
MSTRALKETARALRHEFDASFARAPEVVRHHAHDFLTLGVGGDPYAVPLADVAGLHKDWRVVAIPSDAPELLGVAGHRGTLVPVYDLAALVGYRPERSARWIATVPSSLVALAFARFDGHVQLPSEAVSAQRGAGAYVRGMLSVAGPPRPILDLRAVVEVVSRRSP